MAFHNPYHFVPVQPGGRPDDIAVADFLDGKVEHVTHDRFASRTTQAQPVYSGRMICRLTTEDPIVIGDKRAKELRDGSPQVLPFELEGKPAIPASTLRGLLASIAEAASNSALRVLENRLFSYRAEMVGALSAIGMIVEARDEDGRTALRLRPLALPTMEGPQGGSIPLKGEYRKMFPMARIPPLKVYVGNEDQIRTDSFVPGLPFQSFSPNCPQYCYAKLYPRQWNDNHALSPGAHQYRKAGGGADFLLSQTTIDGLPPCLESELPDKEEERKLYTRGILRILGVPGREDIPNTKKHELFIPYPDGVEHLPTFPILQGALDRFYELADERTEARKDEPFLPYEPRGTARNNAPENKDDKRFRLKAGDLVYFRPNSQGDTVEEIALSAIWRREKGRSHDYFRRLSPELLPFHKDRRQLTIAEQLFGFVEQRQKGQDGPVPARALAGRLRFSFGLLHSAEDDHYEPEVLLKILDSPKPPSPALYFKRASGQGAYIAKKDLHPQSHAPQGRKFYLHRYAPLATPWKTSPGTGNLNQKSWVQPLKSGLMFYFHIDFDNLSQRELELLCYAVRPTDSFRHKLGMGKPLGLGKIRIDPIGLFYIDRQARYRETALFEAKRYDGCQVSVKENPSQWPDCYKRERQVAGQNDTRFPAFDILRESFRDSMLRNKMDDIRQALELLGNPEKVRSPVQTPQVAPERGHDPEKETYRWFVANDQGSDGIASQCEFLRPLDDQVDKTNPVLPRLTEHPWKKKP